MKGQTHKGDIHMEGHAHEEHAYEVTYTQRDTYMEATYT